MTPSDLLAETWSLLVGVLQFRVFVTPSVLLVVYYIGAILIPAVLLAVIWQAMQATGLAIPYAQQFSDWLAQLVRRPFRLVLMALLVFFVSELVWRMMFEFVLAYFQMRDALVAE